MAGAAAFRWLARATGSRSTVRSAFLRSGAVQSHELEHAGSGSGFTHGFRCLVLCRAEGEELLRNMNDAPATRSATDTRRAVEHFEAAVLRTAERAAAQARDVRALEEALEALHKQ